MIIFKGEDTQMDGGGNEMDLTTRNRELPAQDSCKMRIAKSIFSIRSLVNLNENAEGVETNEDSTNNGK